jgi:hypothetical protein
MNKELQPHGDVRRNRLIAIGAGVITVIAIVVGFAGDFLGLPWHWMRPAAELLLLAELVGLVVLERHQLFEPVHEKVTRIDNTVLALAERLAASGQVTACASPPEVLKTGARIFREAFARNSESQQILRVAALSGRSGASDRWIVPERQEFVNAGLAYMLSPSSPSESRARWWAMRVLVRLATVEDFELNLEVMDAPYFERNPMNLELKFAVHPQHDAVLSPLLITDRETLLVFDDAIPMHWGLLIEGREYAALCIRWFDDLWASVPDANLVYSRSGLNQKALERIRKELESRTGGGYRPKTF